MRNDPVISLSQVAKLHERGQVDELIKAISRMGGKSELTLSVGEYRALTNFQKGMFLHKGGGLKRPSMTRAEFDHMTPRQKTNFIRDGGKLTEELK
jgi:hypothetical protein